MKRFAFHVAVLNVFLVKNAYCIQIEVILC